MAPFKFSGKHKKKKEEQGEIAEDHQELPEPPTTIVHSSDDEDAYSSPVRSLPVSEYDYETASNVLMEPEDLTEDTKKKKKKKKGWVQLAAGAIGGGEGKKKKEHASTEDLEPVIATLRTEIRTTESQLEEITAERDALQDLISCKEVTMKALQAELDEAAEAADDRDGTISRLQEEIAELQDKVEGLSNEKVHAQSANNDETAMLRAHIGELTEELQMGRARILRIGELERQLETAQSDMVATEKRLEAAELVRQELSVTCRELQQQVDILEQEKQHQDTRVQELQTVVERERAAASAAQEDLSRLRMAQATGDDVEMLMQLEKELDTARTQLQDVEGRESKLKDNLLEVQQAMVRAAAEHNSRMDAATKEHTQVAKELQETLALRDLQNSELESLLKAAQGDKHEFEVLQKEQEEAIRTLTEMSQKTEVEVSKMMNETKHLTAELMVVKAEKNALEREVKTKDNDMMEVVRAHKGEMNIHTHNLQQEKDALIMSYDKEIVDLQKQMEEETAEFARSVQEAEEEKAAMQSTIGRLDAEKRELQRQMELSTKDRQAAADKNEQLRIDEQQKMREQSQELASLRTQLEAERKEKMKLSSDRDLADQETRAKMLTEQAALRTELDSATQKERHVEKAKNDMEAERDFMEMKLHKAEAHVQEVTEENSKSQSIIREQRRKVFDLEQTQEELQLELDAIKRDKQKKENELRDDQSNTRHDLEEARQKLSKAETNNAHLVKEHQMTVHELQKHIAELTEVMNEQELALSKVAGESNETIEGSREVGEAVGSFIVHGKGIPSTTRIASKGAIPVNAEPHSTTVAIISILRRPLVKLLFDELDVDDNAAVNDLLKNVYSEAESSTTGVVADQPAVDHAARVLRRVERLWQMSEEMRLAFVHLDVSLAPTYQHTQTTIDDWHRTLRMIKEWTESVIQRAEQMEQLAAAYAETTEKARNVAQEDRTRVKQLLIRMKKQVLQSENARRAAVQDRDVYAKKLREIQNDLQRPSSRITMPSTPSFNPQTVLNSLVDLPANSDEWLVTGTSSRPKQYVTAPGGTRRSASPKSRGGERANKNNGGSSAVHTDGDRMAERHSQRSLSPLKPQVIDTSTPPTGERCPQGTNAGLSRSPLCDVLSVQGPFPLPEVTAGDNVNINKTRQSGLAKSTKSVVSTSALPRPVENVSKPLTRISSSALRPADAEMSQISDRRQTSRSQQSEQQMPKPYVLTPGAEKQRFVGQTLTTAVPQYSASTLPHQNRLALKPDQERRRQASAPVPTYAVSSPTIVRSSIRAHPT